MGLSVDRRRGRLDYSRYTFHLRFWRVDLATGTAEELTGLSSTRYDSELALSPDGSRLAFTSTRSGEFEIWTSDPDGGDALRLTDFRGPFAGHPAWSPDGRWIAFAGTVSGDADVWRVAARGGLPERLTSATSHELAPAYSRDGRRLYFASNRTAAWEVWARDLEGGGAAAQVTRGGGFYSAESPGGRWLYFSRRGEAGLWRQPVEGGGEATAVLPGLGRRNSGNWAVSAAGVFFFTEDEARRPAVALLEPGGGEARQIARLPGWPMNPCLALAPDGRFLIYTEGRAMESDIMVAEGLFPR